MKTNPKYRKYFLAFFIVLIIALSFFRESVFVNINLHMWYLYYENDTSHLASRLSFLFPLSYAQLYWLKWILTIFFSGLFLTLSCFIIGFVYEEKKFIRWTIYSFAAVLLISGLCYGAGIILNEPRKGYLFSRFFMGMLQSPFLLMLLIPAFKLADVSDAKK